MEPLEQAIIDSKERLLAYFRFDHLRGGLREASQPFADQAILIVQRFPSSPERTVGLRKLLEAKDCIVRCALDAMNQAVIDNAQAPPK